MLNIDCFLNKIRATISQQLENNTCEFEKLRNILIDMKSHGYSSSQVTSLLENLRSEFDGTNGEDYVLWIMDISTGFCSQHMRVW